MSKNIESPWTVIDLFSGAGGMSYGFHAHHKFRLLGAIDAQIGKPSSGRGSLGCNLTYKANFGIEPLDEDLSELEPSSLREIYADSLSGNNPTVLISCAPCTGFSRTLAKNHLFDDPRNSLVTRSALFVKELKPTIFIMENARELLNGKFSHHFKMLRTILESNGYNVYANNYMLNEFGLPQIRERAIIIASRKDFPLYSLEDLWAGFRVKEKSTHVRKAISHLPKVKAGETHLSDPLHVSPSFAKKQSIRRLQLIPKDGGSWSDLRHHPEAESLLTPAMLRYIAKGKFGSHPDVYGRLWWDKPAVTIKRECSHTGNGRYAHPEQDRLCTVREMSILQGFPTDCKFVASGVSNMYRHIGDAVPPLISYQLAKVCEWILTGKKCRIEDALLPKTHLTEDDIEDAQYEPKMQFGGGVKMF